MVQSFCQARLPHNRPDLPSLVCPHWRGRFIFHRLGFDALPAGLLQLLSLPVRFCTETARLLRKRPFLHFP